MLPSFRIETHRAWLITAGRQELLCAAVHNPRVDVHSKKKKNRVDVREEEPAR